MAYRISLPTFDEQVAGAWSRDAKRTQADTDRALAKYPLPYQPSLTEVREMMKEDPQLDLYLINEEPEYAKFKNWNMEGQPEK